MNVSNPTRSSTDLQSPRPVRGRVSAVHALAIALTVLWLPVAASAAEITWFAGNGAWSNPGNWWPNRLPQAGDVAWVKAPAGNALWVTYSSPTGPLLSKAHFDSVGSGIGIVVLSQDLLRVTQQNVGLTGRGLVANNGGTNLVGDLNLGFWGGSNGTYDLSAAGSVIANRVFVGVGGTGAFRQLGGTSTIAGDLNVGLLNGANGTYELTPTAQLSTTNIFVGNGGRGVFLHDGAALSIPADLSLAVFGSANGRYELRGGGTISAGRLFVGGGGVGAFLQEDGDVSIWGDTVVGFLGGSNGTFDLLGPSSHESQNLIVGGFGVGRFTQDGGVNVARGDLVVGSLGSGWGTVELLDGALSSTRQYIGSFGRGYVLHSGGTNDVAGLMQIGVWGGAFGRYTLSDAGSLGVGTLVLGGFGVGEFVQKGGITEVFGGVRIAELFNSHSALRLSGGSFDAPAIWNKVHGTLEYTGGSLAADSIANDGLFLLGGEGLRVVDSIVTNNGTVDAAETDVNFVGGFVHRGQYLSVETDNEFQYMVVNNQGTVVADGASRLAFRGDLLLDAPAPGAAWDTTLAELAFLTSGDGTHVLRHAGVEKGPTAGGYVDNYAWGELSIASGESLELQGGSVYVGVLDLGDGIPQIASISGTGQNIYYDLGRAANAYLDGQTYPLAGGGVVTPVPEPGLLVGLASGVLLLSRLRRRRAGSR